MPLPLSSWFAHHLVGFTKATRGVVPAVMLFDERASRGNHASAPIAIAHNRSYRLGEGLHVFWKGTGKVKWKTVDRREQVADVAGQEIMTSDKVTLRVNLIVTFLVTDVIRAVQSTTVSTSNCSLCAGFHTS